MQAASIELGLRREEALIKRVCIRAAPFALDHQLIGRNDRSDEHRAAVPQGQSLFEFHRIAWRASGVSGRLTRRERGGRLFLVHAA